MATVAQLKKRLLQLRGQEQSLAKKALQNSEEAAVNLVAGQLAQGIKSDGSKTDFSYAPFTITVKKTRSGLSAVTSHLTNFDTGESYRNLFMKVGDRDIEFGTNTDKENAISERMDGEAFKPTKDNKEELVRQNVQPIFIKSIKKILFNG